MIVSDAESENADNITDLADSRIQELIKKKKKSLH